MLPINDPGQDRFTHGNHHPDLPGETPAAEFGVKTAAGEGRAARPPAVSTRAAWPAGNISKANESASRKFGIHRRGNASGAMAAYAARAGMEAYVFMPEDTPA